MAQRRGITAIEVIALIIILVITSIAVLFLFNDFQKISNDQTRKASINALHHSLEEVYFDENSSYPETINTTILPSVDPDTLKDPAGVQINDTGSDYQYEPIRCNADGCQGYYLYSDLEKESRYEKRSENN